MGKQNTTRPDERPKLATLELGRFAAAFYVLLAHLVPDVNARALPGAAQIWHWLGVTGGGITVEYFFALSGFVMAASHCRDFGQLLSPLHFWWRRARRIYPMYWLALLIPCYFLYAGQTPASFLRIASLAPVNVHEFLPPAWTLRFEVAFYIMFGLSMLPYIGKPILAIWIGATLWNWWPAGQLHAIHLPEPAALSWFSANGGLHFVDFLGIFFFCGMGAGWIFATLLPGKRLSIGITAIGIALVALLHNYMDFGGPLQSVPMFVVIGIVIATVMLGCAGLERHGVLRLPRPALWLGTLSYPLYILHAALLLVFWKALPAHLQLGSAGILALFYGLLVYLFTIAGIAAFLIDQPLQRWMRRWSKSRPAAPAAQKATA
jgi:exopolysaccharide production protein ExoZ